jgi:hypothetical protein
MAITADTPIDDAILKSKPKLAKLAQLVFDRTEVAALRAFTQFRKPRDLASLIEAKRRDVFDFGACFRDTDAGLAYPNNTNVVMAALEHAMNEEYDQIDLRALGLVDMEGNQLVDIAKLCPGAGKTSKKPTRTQARKPKAEEKPEAKEEPKVEAEKPKAERTRAAPVSRRSEPAPEQDAPQQAVVISTSEVLDAIEGLNQNIETLRNGLAGALQTVIDKNTEAALKKNDLIEDEIGSVRKEVTLLRGAIVGLASFANDIHANIKMVGEYLDPYIEYQEPSEAVVALLRATLPENVEVEDVDLVDVVDPTPDAIEEETQEQAPREEPQEQEEPPAPRETRAREEETSGEHVTYTKDDLSGMTLDELREIGEAVGIANASKMPFKTALIHRILRAQS